MTDLQLASIYSTGLAQSHIVALKLVFAAGYAAHAGTAIQGNPAHTATFPTALPVNFPLNDTDHG
jgi:hypothetical protein